MAAKPESKLQKKIQKALKDEWPDIYIRKTHGGIYTSGEPDLTGCLQGFYFGFEVKSPGKKRTLTKLQALNLSLIQKAGGLAEMVISPEEAIDILKVKLLGTYVPYDYVETE